MGWSLQNKHFFKSLSISEKWIITFTYYQEASFNLVNTNCLEAQVTVVLQGLVKTQFQEADKFHSRGVYTLVGHVKAKAKPCTVFYKGLRIST